MTNYKINIERLRELYVSVFREISDKRLSEELKELMDAFDSLYSQRIFYIKECIRQALKNPVSFSEKPYMVQLDEERRITENEGFEEILLNDLSLLISEKGVLAHNFEVTIKVFMKPPKALFNTDFKPDEFLPPVDHIIYTIYFDQKQEK